MANPYFNFKQFSIRHDRCAMKVGTDGVLLGAWTSVPEGGRILDIGCGSALIAIMLAQRSPASVTGIEIDESAASQAEDNCRESPFADRLSIVCEDVNDFSPDEPFDCVVSNPPFFNERTTAPKAARRTARSTSDGLTHKALLDSAARMLKSGGTLSVIVPFATAPEFISTAADKGLQLTRRTDVTTRPGITPKRALLEFILTNDPVPMLLGTLTLCAEGGKRTEEYSQLTSDFYL